MKKTYVLKTSRKAPDTNPITLTIKPTSRGQLICVDRMVATDYDNAATHVQFGARVGSSDYMFASRIPTIKGELVNMAEKTYVPYDATLTVTVSGHVAGDLIAFWVYGYILDNESQIT